MVLRQMFYDHNILLCSVFVTMSLVADACNSFVLGILSGTCSMKRLTGIMRRMKPRTKHQ